MKDCMKEFVRTEIEATVKTFLRLQINDAMLEEIARVGKACGIAINQRKKIMLIGNGGSAADAQHIAAEFVSRLTTDRVPLPALALTTDTSILTAVANDYGYEKVFARQVEGLGREGDVLIGISTSGRSPNVLAALKAAKQHRIVTVVLTGESGDAMAKLCDYAVRVPSNRTQNIQEVHIMIGHTICAIAEKKFKFEKTGEKGK